MDNSSKQMYSLEDSCKTFVTFDDLPMVIGKTPVTSGSKVPPCPVNFNSKESLNQAATWCEEGPDCLFITITEESNRCSTLR